MPPPPLPPQKRNSFRRASSCVETVIFNWDSRKKLGTHSLGDAMRHRMKHLLTNRGNAFNAGLVNQETRVGSVGPVARFVEPVLHIPSTSTLHKLPKKISTPPLQLSIALNATSANSRAEGGVLGYLRCRCYDISEAVEESMLLTGPR